MRWIFTASCLLCFILLLCRACGAEEWRILCWNVYNYFSADRITESGWRPGFPKAEAEKAAVRRVIRETLSDVVILQEMGTDPYLFELQRDLAGEGIRFDYRYLSTDTDEVRHLAMLAREQPKLVTGHKADTRRGFLELLMGFGEYRVRIFNVHLKSKWTVDPEDPQAMRQRGAEVDALIRILRERVGDADNLLVMGDFNETPAEPARRRLIAAVDGLRLLIAKDEAGEDWTFYWKRGDRHESIDAVYFRPAVSGPVPTIEVGIIAGTEVEQASDHRPLLVRIR